MRADKDYVDVIQQARERERPGIAVESIGVITRIWRIAKLLEDDRRKTMARLKLDVPTRNLLSTLRRAGEPYVLSPSELATRAGVTAGAVSQWVAKCEQHGLVRRSRGNAGDGRAVQIALTAKGRRIIDRVIEELLEHENDLVAGLTSADVAALSDLLRKLLADLNTRALPDASSAPSSTPDGSLRV